MAQLVVRGLAEGVKERLKQLAKSRGRSLEAEVRDILTDVSEALEASSAQPKENIADVLIREQAKHPISDDVWEEFNRNLKDVRRSWKVRKVDFGK